jgi:hypothetical protein
MRSKLSKRFSKITLKHISALLVLLAVVSIGVCLLVSSHAATPYVSNTADNGVVANRAVKQTCRGSSDGVCVQFGFPVTSSLAVHINNGQLVNGMGQPIRLLGVDATGTESNCIDNDGFSDGSLNSTEVAGMKTWDVNAVRVPLNEDCWLGINGAPAAYSGANYQNAIKNWVAALNDAGIIAILDLHWTAPSTYQATQQWSMADEDHSVTFWSQVASAYTESPAVIFDLFNEPNLISSTQPTSSDWNCWLKGCSTTFDATVNGVSTPVSYQTAGMQQLVSTVRSAGATQPVMIGGLRFSNDFCETWQDNVLGGVCTQLPQLPTDPLNQLAVSFHAYNFNACITTGCWSSIAQLTKTAGLPIITGEIGEDDCTDNFINSYTDWADLNNVSYLAWTWSLSTHTSCVPGFSGQGADLQLLSNWDGAPSTISPEAIDYMNHLIHENP